MSTQIKLDLGVPSEKQKLFLTDTHRHVAFGGARGGGKSWSIQRKAILMCLKYDGITCVIVRKSFPELTENHIKPIKKLLKCGTPEAVARYNDSKKEMTFLNGSTILFKYLDTEKDLERFQGLQCQQLFIDEACQLSEIQLKEICAIVRGVDDFPKRTYYTCNPNGQGMPYIKRLFVDRKFDTGETPEDYSFIQSLVTDNKALMEANPEYIKNLEALPPLIREAWLNGRWDVFNGSYWSEIRLEPDAFMCNEANISVEDAKHYGRYTHFIEPFEIPSDWTIERAYDWGYGKPFSVGWFAIDHEETAYQILEWYGCTKNPNEGVKMTNAEQMKHIKEIENNHRWLKGKKIYGVADPSIWDGSHDTDGISCAEIGEKYGVFFDKANNERIGGWMMMREYLKFDEEGKPKLYFFDTCEQTKRTLPLMMFDEKKCEDLDTTLEDHISDMIRYFVMSRPIKPRAVSKQYVPMSDPLNQYDSQTNTTFRRYNSIRG